jgi:guanylate kinase
MSELLLLTGPHGAGKDSVEQGLRQARPDITRTVRHITRKPSNTEFDGVDYHFLTRDQFQELVERDALLEYAVYPDVMSGTTRSAVQDALKQAPYATLTLNVEDAIPLHRRLIEFGVQSRKFFISPVAESAFREDEAIYLSVLQERMEARGRPDDRIENKLAKAALYRTMYLDDPAEFIYVYNPDSQLDLAVQAIARQLEYR